MGHSGKLKVSTPSEREIELRRVFNAPRHLVFEALTNPDLVRRWLSGMPGWTMPVCEIDLRVGGNYRYVWRHENGNEMGMGGTYREIEPPERIVNTEQFDDPWYPGEGLVTTRLISENDATIMTETILYESKEARDAVLQSPMESGVALSFDRLEKLLKIMSKSNT